MRVVSAINLMKNARPRSGFGADYRPARAVSTFCESKGFTMSRE